MERPKELIPLLQKKEELFLAFEEETEQMLTCDAGMLEDRVARRQKLIASLDRLDREIEEGCASLPEGAAAREAIRHTAARHGLPEELRAVYDASMRVKTVLNRIQESDLQAAIRLRLEQENILKKIKSANQGVEAKAARFYSDSSARTAPNRFGRA